ncbi:hypothetical protein BH10BAC5_BH10BAC5_01380 [soil metagenome]
MKIQIDFHDDQAIIHSVSSENSIPVPEVGDTVEIKQTEYIVDDKNFMYSDEMILIEIYLTKEFDGEEDDYDEDEGERY